LKNYLEVEFEKMIADDDLSEGSFATEEEEKIDEE